MSCNQAFQSQGLLPTLLLSCHEQATNTNQEAYRLQLKMFLALLHQQRHLPSLKQLLKLYTVSIPVPTT